MLQFINVEKKFGRLEVLKQVNLDLAGSQVIAIVGPNGSGKTTMLKCLLGLVVPDKGDILLDGKSILNDWSYREQLGYMSQISRFPENITIGEVIRMMKDIRHEVRDYDEDLLKEFKLEQMYDKKLGTLSGGTRQKVSAVLAFLFNPRIIILDEPTAGLDPVATEQIKQKIHQEKTKGNLVLITSHIMSDIEELADSLVYIIDGKIRMHSTISEIKHQTGEGTFGRAMAKITEAYHD